MESNSTKKISLSIVDILDKLNQNDSFRLEKLLNLWPPFFGIKPVKIRGSTLYVKCNKLAQMEFYYQKPQLLKLIESQGLYSIIIDKT